MASSRYIPTVSYQLEGITLKLPFYQCAVQLFQENMGKPCCYVDDIGYSFNDSVLLLSRQNDGMKLYHSIDCPLVSHARSDEKDLSQKDSDVLIGAAVLLRSSDGLILLSRRSKRLKTFPGVWVPPGGHLESGETLEAAAIRELGEEVGIVLSTSEFSIKPLCLFESCFPPFIEWGQPKRHHIVIYYLMESTLTKNELNSRLKLLEAEVDACAWLPDKVTKALHEEMYDNLPSVEFMTIQDGVFTSNLHLDPAVFIANRTGNDNHDIERISTGTLTALKSYVEQYII